jgi:two-component system response regulator RegA
VSAPAPRGALLLVEDDAVFAGALARALRTRGFDVQCAVDAECALASTRGQRPRYAVIDLKLGNDSGLDLISSLGDAVPGVRMLLLTGYASIATAVEAIRRGAHDYLAKPVDADTVVRALLEEAEDRVAARRADAVPESSLPLRRMEWEYIQRILRECDGNISKTADRLGIYRRTLQRKLEKHPVRERAG